MFILIFSRYILKYLHDNFCKISWKFVKYLKILNILKTKNNLIIFMLVKFQSKSRAYVNFKKFLA